MATELLGAKMLAPYFGSSLYVWASVLAITLGGLAMGYFVGGILSYKSKNTLVLFNVLVAAAIFTILMPYTAKIILGIIGYHSLIPSVIVCGSIILLPPVFMMGMVSPLIIKSITIHAEESGKASGAIYAISTLGGIIATFLFGFYIIPQFGITIPSIITGIVLGILPLIILIKHKGIKSSIGFFVLSAFAIWNSAATPSNSVAKVIYQSEGLLGQLTVIDFPRYYGAKDNSEGRSRWLFVNKISQTMFDSLADENKKEEKYFTYVYRISEFTDSLPKRSKILVLGLGGGSIAQVLSKKGFDVDACELDKRIAMIAKNYFYLNNKVNITIDDARHYIKTCTKKYDLIIMDIFKGEDVPNHVFTKESLEETNKILQPNGTIIVNSFGYIEGEEGKAMRSIYKTFPAAGYNVEVMATDPDPDKSNLLFFASLDPIKNRFSFIPKNKIDLADAVILSDEYPLLDILNAKAAMRWRSLAINMVVNDNNQKSLPLFE